MPSRLAVPEPAPFQCSPTVSPTASLWISTRSLANSSARRLRRGKPRQAGMLSGETSPDGHTMGPAAATPMPSRSPGMTSAPRRAAAAQASRASYSSSGSGSVGEGTRPRPSMRPLSSTTAAASLVPPTSSARTVAIGGRYLISSSFSRTAYTTASILECRCSFSRMLRMWFLTVFSEM